MSASSAHTEFPVRSDPTWPTAPRGFKENRRDRRLAINQTGKRRVVVAMRERNGRTLPFVLKSEAESVAKIASFFSRIRRSEFGIHHHLSGPCLAAYSREMASQEDRRRVGNGEQWLTIAILTLAHPVLCANGKDIGSGALRIGACRETGCLLP